MSTSGTVEALLPRPEKITHLKGSMLLHEPVEIVVSPGASDQEDYAAGQLRKELRSRWGVKAHIRTQGKASAGPVARICLFTSASAREFKTIPGSTLVTAKVKTLSQQGFVIRVNPRANTVFVGGKDGPGVIYGAFALLELVSSRKGKASVPGVQIIDQPKVLIRAMTVDPVKSRHYLDLMARWRMNAYFTADPEPSRIADAHRRGIKVYGCRSQLRKDYCFSRTRDVEKLLADFRSFLRMGCDGVVMLFDDLSIENSHGHCPKCIKRFGDLAGEQIFIMEKIMEVARKCGRDDQVVMCPTPYFRGWERPQELYEGTLDGVDYYGKIASRPKLKKMKMFFCPFSPKEVKEVEKAGLRNFVWWNNAPRDLSYWFRGNIHELRGVYGGFPELSWGWYTITKTAKDPVAIRTTPSDLREMKKVHTLTRDAWLCGGLNEYAHGMWGIFTWNPADYNQARAERKIIPEIFGPGAYKLAKEWNELYRQVYTTLLIRPKVEIVHDGKSVFGLAVLYMGKFRMRPDIRAKLRKELSETRAKIAVIERLLRKLIAASQKPQAAGYPNAVAAKYLKDMKRGLDFMKGRAKKMKPEDLLEKKFTVNELLER